MRTGNLIWAPDIHIKMKGDDSLIRFIVGRNLGHLNPCVATVSKFMTLSKEPVKIYAFTHTHRWLRSNLPKAKIRTFRKQKWKETGKTMLNANLIIHDWREEVQKLKGMRNGNGPIIAGIYHSDMSVTSEDTEMTRKFKQQIRDISQKATDIFFHINLTQPKEIPQLSTLYVPIPLIAREITMEPGDVKKRLGLHPDEPFILVQMGGGVGRYRYKFMEEWYEKVSKLKLPYRIVIANQFKGIDFSFEDHIIQAPLFDNGRDLVNAAAAVISKPGMGILMDSISTGTPLLALPADTKEREVKNMMLRDLVGSDICLASSRFSPKDLARRIHEVLKYSKQIRKAYGKVPQTGTEIVAESMKMLSGRPLSELPELYEQILGLTPFRVK